jgi:hypothetical protein
MLENTLPLVPDRAWEEAAAPSRNNEESLMTPGDVIVLSVLATFAVVVIGGTLAGLLAK